MALTNLQYATLFREYEDKQMRSRKTQMERVYEIYSAIPEYETADDAVSTASLEQARRLLQGDHDALDELKNRLNELKERKSSLLRAHGYPENYLEPVYECPKCRDTGYIGNQKCSCLKQKIVSILYEQSNIKEHLTEENFDTLRTDFYQGEDLAAFQKTVAAAHAFVNNFKSEYRNLLFYGNVGVGKTFLSNCIAKELIEQGQLVLYFSASGLIEALRNNNSSQKTGEDLYNSNEDLYNCDLLLIDDLGTEYNNAYVTTQLFNCLNERHLRKKATLISTNLSLEDIRDRYSDRIFSRISSHYDLYKITGPDIRMSKKTLSVRK